MNCETKASPRTPRTWRFHSPPVLGPAALLVALLVSQPAAAQGASCTVRGDHLVLERVTPTAGGQGGSLSIDDASAQVTLSSAVRSARVAVDGAITFQGRMDTATLPLQLAPGTRLAGGALVTGDPRSMELRLQLGTKLQASLTADGLTAEGVDVPCRALRLGRGPAAPPIALTDHYTALERHDPSVLALARAQHWRWAAPTPAAPTDAEIGRSELALRDGPQGAVQITLRLRRGAALGVHIEERRDGWALVEAPLSGDAKLRGWVPGHWLGRRGRGAPAPVAVPRSARRAPRQVASHGVFVGPAVISRGTRIHGEPSGRAWGQYEGDRTALVRHRQGEGWVELLEIPGVNLHGLRAWVPLSAARLNAIGRHGLTVQGSHPHQQAERRWHVTELGGQHFEALGLRPGDVLALFTGDGDLQEVLTGAYPDAIESFLSELYDDLWAAARWPASGAGGTLEILRGGMRLQLPVPAARMGLFCECDHCDITTCPEGLSELLR